MDFTFSDYITLMGKQLGRQPEATGAGGLTELAAIKDHTAPANVMARHIKYYRTLKEMADRYGITLKNTENE